MKRLALSIVVVPWLGITVGRAEANAAPPAGATGSLQAHRVSGAIRVDGRLDEEAWGEAAAAGEFVQEAPHYGEAGASPPEVRGLYDDQYLYVGARLRHPAAARRGH